jgi:hypothetical protein
MSLFWNTVYSGRGGCFRISINKIPSPESFFFILACKDSAKYAIMRIKSRDGAKAQSTI